MAIVTPTHVKNDSGLDLPGRLQAYITAPIYARVPGYLKDWKYDIGGKVKAGDLLAEIETPDLDQQLMQARAALSVAQANAKLAQITAERWQSLANTDAVAKQDVDTRTFTWNANVAQVKAAQANVDQLVAEEGFKRLIAPFDGIVTARDTDIGALINVGASGGQQLFVVSETSKLRVYVNVPQNYVPSVPPGTKATIRVPEHPDKTYSGTVEASAQAVIPSTGTTLMQLIVDAKKAPGDADLPGDDTSILSSANRRPRQRAQCVPSSAPDLRRQGLSIATVNADDHVVPQTGVDRTGLGRDHQRPASGPSPRTTAPSKNPPDGIGNGTQSVASKTAAAGRRGCRRKQRRIKMKKGLQGSTPRRGAKANAAARRLFASRRR